MCGIVGFIGQVQENRWGQTHRLLEALMLASAHRGWDATGFAALTSPYKRQYAVKTIVEKQPIAVGKFVKANGPWRQLRHQRCSAVICHIRMATHGDPSVNRNNHPFSTRDGLHLVHNGVIVDHKHAAAKRRLRLKTECDSEILLRLIEAARHPAIGLEEALLLLRGSIAAVVLDSKTGMLWLARNHGRELWLLKLRDGRTFIASESQILLVAAKKVLGKGYRHEVDMLIPLAAHHVHGLSPSGQCLGMDAVR